jgi:ferric-dicitrate binding protein FerR (iron transport regulator)
MSREERRAYQRMTKKQDPYALPGAAAAKARQERQHARRPRPPAATVGGMGTRFLLFALAGGALAGLVAFSLAWPKMPLAAYVGIGVAAGWILVSFGLRLIGRRAAARR